MTDRQRKEKKRVTLSDVSKAAGVSVMTVSNVVRGKDKFVGIKTRKHVEEVLARMNYRINVSARNLRVAEEHSVGMVIVNSDPAFLIDPFISRLVSGLSNYLSRLDYTLDIQGVVPERFEKATILSKARNDAMCAVLCGPEESRREYLAYLQRLGQPLVIFQEVFKSPSPDVAIIRQDDQAGGTMLMQHLLKKSLRKCVFLRPEIEWPAVEQREKGLRNALSESGNEECEVLILKTSSEKFEDVQKTVAEYLSEDKPDAIMAATDSMAVAALKVCEEKGLRVPEDIMITGFNGFDVWRYTRPQLTTVMSPAYEMGQYGGELLMQKLNKGTFQKRNVVFPVTLQVSASA